jgi:excisionase family DNA binding protein
VAGTLAQDAAQHLRTALDEALRDTPELPATARAAFGRLVDVLEAKADAVIFPADATVSTQRAAELLGVSRMTVVRLVDRGELAAEGGAVHRRISVSELGRYHAENCRRHRSAVAELAADIDQDLPPNEPIRTR